MLEMSDIHPSPAVSAFFGTNLGDDPLFADITPESDFLLMSHSPSALSCLHITLEGPVSCFEVIALI